MFEQKLVDRSDFLLDTPLEAGPTFLPAEGLQAAVHAVLHHRDELLVAQHAVAVVVKNLKQKNQFLNDFTIDPTGISNVCLSMCLSVYMIILLNSIIELEDNKNVV